MRLEAIAGDPLQCIIPPYGAEIAGTCVQAGLSSV
jgi:hypothetical protein